MPCTDHCTPKQVLPFTAPFLSSYTAKGSQLPAVAIASIHRNAFNIHCAQHRTGEGILMSQQTGEGAR